MSSRFVLIVSHTRRVEARVSAEQAVNGLLAAGITPVFPSHDLSELQGAGVNFSGPVMTLGQGVEVSELELAMVLGGDGTILKAAELVRESSTPLLGINLGHVGSVSYTHLTLPTTSRV